MLFDAKVQFKSDEISDSVFETIQKHCNNLLERLSHERVEVINVQRRIEASLIGNDVKINQSENRPRAHQIMIGDQGRIDFA